MKLTAITSLFALGFVSTLAASEAVNVTNSINNDSISTITIVQPLALEHRLQYQSAPQQSSPAVEDSARDESDEAGSGVAAKMAGYRVQVFSDNNQRTARGEARNKEMMLREAFPEFETYIVYNSPFWRLKVGDFRTQHEAEAAADDIKMRFPDFAREIRVVRDRINVQR